ncbi:MAG TPA: long-chain fatty acid--CoA ligase [Polyangiaceae bacterium]|nr:long-chain fatty acid--CoA ligase [Polyangiaceae bacterium]
MTLQHTPPSKSPIPKHDRPSPGAEPGHLALLFQERVERYGDKTALRYEAGGSWHDISWKQFGEDIHATAKGLLELGVQEGERVGIYSANRPEWTVADLAAMRIRAVPVPIYATSTAKQARYILDDAGIRVLFVGGRDQYDRARSLFGDHHRLKLILFDPAVARDPSYGSIYFLDLLEKGRHAERDDEVQRRLSRARPEDLATLIYTSGTTGVPKGVMLDHANIVSALPPHDLRLLDPNEDDRSLCFLPLSHVFERCWTFYALSRGMTNHYLEDPTRVLDAVKEVRPTIMCVVPRLYEKIYAEVNRRAETGSPVRRRLFHWAIAVGAEAARHRREELPLSPALEMKHRIADALVLRKIRAILGGSIKFTPCAGAPLSREVEDFFTAAGLFICQGYGLTETCATVTCYETLHYKPGTVGKPLPGIQVKIAEDGEVLVKGHGVMRGYFNKPDETAATLVDGWFRTGDAGTLDPDGTLHITDRIKDLMKTSGGKYVAPQHLEADLGGDIYIAQAAVVGDLRKYVTALLVPSFPALEEWALARGLSWSSREELIRLPEVLSLYRERVDAHNARLARHEQIKDFTLLPKEFSIDAGELTPTMKTRRKQILSTYRGAIDAMYG